MSDRLEEIKERYKSKPLGIDAIHDFIWLVKEVERLREKQERWDKWYRETLGLAKKLFPKEYEHVLSKRFSTNAIAGEQPQRGILK